LKGCVKKGWSSGKLVQSNDSVLGNVWCRDVGKGGRCRRWREKKESGEGESWEKREKRTGGSSCWIRDESAGEYLEYVKGKRAFRREWAFKRKKEVKGKEAPFLSGIWMKRNGQSEKELGAGSVQGVAIREAV